MQDEVEVVRGQLLCDPLPYAIARAGDTGPRLRAVVVEMQSRGPEEGRGEDDDLIRGIGEREDTSGVDYLRDDCHCGAKKMRSKRNTGREMMYSGFLYIVPQSVVVVVVVLQ